MMDIDIEKLKRKALASHGGLDVWYTANQMYDLQDDTDAEYIATATPGSVLALIERLEAAELYAARYRDALKSLVAVARRVPFFERAGFSCTDTELNNAIDGADAAIAKEQA